MNHGSSHARETVKSGFTLPPTRCRDVRGSRRDAVMCMDLCRMDLDRVTSDGLLAACWLARGATLKSQL